MLKYLRKYQYQRGRKWQKGIKGVWVIGPVLVQYPFAKAHAPTMSERLIDRCLMLLPLWSLQSSERSRAHAQILEPRVKKCLKCLSHLISILDARYISVELWPGLVLSQDEAPLTQSPGTFRSLLAIFLQSHVSHIYAKICQAYKLNFSLSRSFWTTKLRTNGMLHCPSELRPNATASPSLRSKTSMDTDCQKMSKASQVLCIGNLGLWLYANYLQLLWRILLQVAAQVPSQKRQDHPSI